MRTFDEFRVIECLDGFFDYGFFRNFKSFDGFPECEICRLQRIGEQANTDPLR